jgi:UDP-GlcNAc:undecaprenyl-phosphate GlcNAc-1-phosphate transferase
MFLPLGSSLVLAGVTTPLAMKVSRRYHLMDQPSRHKRHKQPTPVLGGAALFLSFWTALAVSFVFLPAEFEQLMGRIPYILAGSLIIFLVGLSDDLSPVSAWVKLVAQVAAGLVLFLGGLEIDPLTVPFAGSVHLGSWSVLITVLWVVGLSNALNIIDGLDGLAAGVGLIAAISLIAIGSIFDDLQVAVLSLVVAGFLVPFLVYNRYPARIFLGDSGALQLGYYFAVISLLVPIRTYTAAALYVPLLCLGVPILEALISFWRRLVSGRNVFRADRRHIFHYLALAGLSPGRIVWLFYAVSVVFGLFSVAVIYLNQRWVFGFLLLFMVVIFGLFYIFMSHLNRPGRQRTDQGA